VAFYPTVLRGATGHDALESQERRRYGSSATVRGRAFASDFKLVECSRKLEREHARVE